MILTLILHCFDTFSIAFCALLIIYIVEIT